MRTGFETKKVIVLVGNVATGSQASVNVVDGASGAIVVGCTEAGVRDTVADRAGRRGDARGGIAELIDVEVADVDTSAPKARQTGRWFLI